MASAETEFQKERRTILIAGAGIAGLACALYVERAGYRVEIFEQATALDPVGSGIQLSPNAMHVLAELGLDRQIKSVAIAPSQIDIREATSGRNITKIALGEAIVTQYGQPYLTIHRADLQNILLASCKSKPDIHLKMGIVIRDAVSHPNGISIIADGKTGTQNFRGAALIGADGVHSIIRNECFETQKEKSTKTIALRALMRIDDIPAGLQTGDITMWLGSDAHAVLYPVRGSGYYNVVLTVAEDFCRSFNANNIFGHEIASGLAKWNSDFMSLLDINTHWTQWPLYDAPTLKHWHEGCVVLIGDAAHAMTPHAAQGAAMALEDAAVLGKAIGKKTDLETAFGEYQNTRMKRVNAVRRISAMNRIIYQLPPGLSHIRNIGMWVLGGKKIFNRQDWIYRWRP